MLDAWWPLRGLLDFLAAPRRWLAPLLALAAGGIVLVALGVAAAWTLWPVGGSDWWPYLWKASRACGIGMVAVLGGWVVVVPLMLSLGLERLARSVQRDAGAAATVAEPALAALGSTLVVIGGTLAPRLAWLALGLLTTLTGGPLGVMVGALGLAHVAAIDSIDLALAVRGLSGQQRLAALRAHRGDLRGGALIAAGLNLGLAITVIGWLAWLPGLVCGAARLVLAWPEVRAREPAAGLP